MNQTGKSKADSDDAFRELHAMIKSVVIAGTEQGLEATKLINLEAGTTDRVREIYEQTTRG